MGQATPAIQQLIALSRLYGVSIDSMVMPETDCGMAQYKHARREPSVIIPFLLRAKSQTYAGKGLEISASRTASHDYQYREGEMLYYETYLGSEQFAGQEAVWVAEQPLWSMNYQGRVLAEGFSGDFLKQALLHGTPENPFRGSSRFTQGEWLYQCSWKGSFAWFTGEESIWRAENKIYECLFHGGTLK